MRISVTLIALLALGSAAMLSLLVAIVAVDRIEHASRAEVTEKLVSNNLIWPSVSVDGLRVILSGVAPTEADRFQVLSLSAEIVDSDRVIDAMQVAAGADIAPPDFSMEILRNDGDISAIGLIPSQMDREMLVESMEALVGGQPVTDLLESANYPVPSDWDETISYALQALESLPRSKISVQPGVVTITAITDSVQSRKRLEQRLLRDAPSKLDLMLDLSAPRPVITPFTLRFLIEDGVGRFDACSADTEDTRERILRAAETVGLGETSGCVIGLGQPSPRWGEAVETAIAGLAEIGSGSVTFSDADVTLIAAETTPSALFERVTAELEADLPDLFSLHAILTEPVEKDPSVDETGEPEFIATLGPEGLIQLRGRVSDELTRMAMTSYAHSRFGTDNVYSATLIDESLPGGWSLRVLAGLEAMSHLANGQVIVKPGTVAVRGATGNENARAEISRILSDKLGEAQDFSVNVTYIKQLDPLANIPTPQECVASINEMLDANKITFDPGSADISAEASSLLTDLAEQVRSCEHVKMEIGGHTDSQGREIMNQNLSQARADSVLNALLARRVLTSNLTAKGYGESQPIADNGTEEGREANRRITFTLIDSETPESDVAEKEPDQQEEGQEVSQDEQN